MEIRPYVLRHHNELERRQTGLNQDNCERLEGCSTVHVVAISLKSVDDHLSNGIEFTRPEYRVNSEPGELRCTIGACPPRKGPF